MFFTLCILVFLTGCADKRPTNVAALQQWEGKEVTVFFRRDLLGAAGAPIDPTSTRLNHSVVSLNGKMISARMEGIFLDSRYKLNQDDPELRQSVFWIPNESILSVKSDE